MTQIRFGGCDLSPRRGTPASRRLAQGATAALAVALAVTGCGGSGRLSKSAYEQQLQTQAHRLRDASAALGLAPSAARLRAEARALDRTAAALDKLKPPKDVDADNHRVVSGLRRIAAIFDAVAGAATDAQRRRALEALARSPASEDVQKALDDMRRKGYDIGAFGRGS